jgi:hypothetical protein
MWIEEMERIDVDKGDGENGCGWRRWREWMWIEEMERMDVDRGGGENGCG